MKSSELRWSHIHAAIAALERGATGPEAANEAGIGPRVWRLLRGKRSGPQVLALLAKNDPDGKKAYLSELDELCAACITGRPRTQGTHRTEAAPTEAYRLPAQDLYGNEGPGPNIEGRALLGPSLKGF